MCSIVGFIKKRDNFDSIKVIKKMNNSMSHRGPDFSSYWINNNSKIVFGHNRLSIIDLSLNGAQPMHSNDNRYVITFNGEIYNYKKLKKEIDNNFNFQNKWKSTSDTEVLLNLVQFYGFDKAIKKIKGMYAFSIWDKEKECLYLVRDRVGEKPLYYGFINNDFVFTSELKSLYLYPGYKRELDNSSIKQLIDKGYICSPRSIDKNFKKINPGTYLKKEKNNEIKIIRYWDKDSQYINEVNDYKNSAKIENKVENLLNNSLSDQLFADVPVGVFLSGGIDSSLITALISKYHNNKIKTFTIGFKEAEHNEANQAKLISKYLKTDHNEFYLDSKIALDIIPNLSDIYCEPFGDSSQIPTKIVSNIAKQNVSVAISGDGGDELFGGYNRYTQAQKFFRIIKYLPKDIRKILSFLMLNLKPKNTLQLYKIISFFLNKNYKLNDFNDKILKIGRVLLSESYDEYYNNVTSNIHIYGNIFNKKINFAKQTITINSIEEMLSNDFNYYLPDDILCKVDRASMSESLETRSPYLDDELVSFATNIPLNYKINNRENKIPLKNILRKYLPEELVIKQKKGFGIPLNSWLRSDLRPWAEELLSKNNINKTDIFDYIEVQKIWNLHISNNANMQNILWPLLMFLDWNNK